MKKIFAAAGVASLLVVSAPLVAQAAPRDHAQHDQYSGSARHAGDSHRSHDADRSARRDHVERRVENRERDIRRHREVRRERIERRYAQAERSHQRAMARHYRHREFRHWRPGLERAHYRHFSAPVHSNGYYRVHAHDRDDRLVFLTISALTGAIIAFSY